MPLHLSDIEADLARRDISGMEDGFRALVDWPDLTERRIGVPEPIVGSTLGQRREILVRLAETLVDIESDRIMPRDTFQAILDECEDMDGGTYADGARAVLGNPRPFLDRLGQEA